MIRSKRFIDIDELCVEARREEFRISNLDLLARWSIVICDFVFFVEQLIPNELSCIHELKQTFVIT